jgi:hypothetical protein
MEVAMRWALILLGIVTMANFSPEQLAQALMMQQASMLTPEEEGQMRTDPSFEDWVRTFQPRIRGGELSREQAIQMHMQKWPGSGIHQGPEPSRRPKTRKDI